VSEKSRNGAKSGPWCDVKEEGGSKGKGEQKLVS